MSSKTKFFKIVLPLIIIFAGVALMAIMMSFRREPEKRETVDAGALVNVIRVKKVDRNIIVHGTGTVEPASEISVVPQVSGIVKDVSRSFVAGGFLNKGDIMIALEEDDYVLAIENARSLVSKAEYELATVESQAEIARQEWDKLKREGEGASPLALFEPQMRNAIANLDSARAALRQSEINLERTKLRAPFNSRVRSETVDMGKYVRSGEQIAVIAGTDSAEILVPLPLEDIAWMDVPRSGTGDAGAKARIKVNVGGTVHEWDGNVVRSVGEVDPKTRMLTVVVGIDDPYGLESSSKRIQPLLGGTFVDVDLLGRRVRDVVALPRGTLREGSVVWTVDGEGLLKMKKVETLRIDDKEILISEGLEDGDLVIVSNLVGAAEGKKLRPVELERNR